MPLQIYETDHGTKKRASPKPNCKCGAKSVYYRAYNGESLCLGCFNRSIFEKTKKTISKYGMLKFGDKIAVAISGGKDSSSLLFVLNEITRGHGTTLEAITIDEGIAGYRDESIKNAKSLAEKLAVPLSVRSYKDFFGVTLDEALERRDRAALSTTSCAVCGPLRRRSIDETAEMIGADVVATAHNLDDVLQTFFINLHSGDFERVKWLNPSFKQSKNFKLRRIKPFMEIYEQELAFFAFSNGLPFQSESCPYMNEGIRSEIRTHLNELEKNHPGSKYSTLKTVMQITKSLSAERSKEIRACAKCGSVCTGTVCSVCQTIQQLS
jgi:cytoplasmic tRNA 2-thiolation protein 1